MRDGLWVWRRGTGTLVALNLADSAATVALDGFGETPRQATIRLSTRRGTRAPARRCEAPFALAPWEGVVLSPS